jgi:ABC-type branched-subunit amino acid transport system substrate-binding protein
MAESLGPLAHGMVFSQVWPSPWVRKTEITREYQDEFKRANPTHEFSYGSLEGYVTAKALVAALRLAGPRPTREGFVRALDGAVLQLGGLKSSYRAGDNEGSTFVDLSIVTPQGKFLQ